jgi:hypothetical protein
MRDFEICKERQAERMLDKCNFSTAVTTTRVATSHGPASSASGSLRRTTPSRAA